MTLSHRRMPRSSALFLLITSLATLALGTACLDDKGVGGKPAEDGGNPDPSTSTPPDGEAPRCLDGGQGEGCAPVDCDDCDADTPRCGNGTVDANEECDDGNVTPGDQCSADCKRELVTDRCVKANSEPLPSMLHVVLDNMGNGGSGGGGAMPPKDRVVTRSELFRRFNSSCGAGIGNGCHVGTSLSPTAKGLFQVVEDTFADRPKLGEESLAAILSPDPAKAMPLGGGAGDKRPCDNPVHTLGRELEAFQASGFKDEFTVAPCLTDPGEEDPNELPEAPPGCEIPEEPYLQPAALAEAQTNLGTCVLPAEAAGIREATRCSAEYLAAKDAFFAGLTDSTKLPDNLVETDLVSLDSEVLLRHEVYSYSPTYTLFSDNAKKQRYFRVPAGKAVTYNPDTNEFEVPDNTRFYKTFLKPVTDKQGNTRYRKMETRIIVVRSDVAEAGGYKVRALRGTYAWSQDERTATLVRDQLRSGGFFADRLCPYVVDENVTRDPNVNPIIRSIQGADGKCVSDMGNCTTMTQAECEDPSSGKIRHYAIPGSERCDQCHMGSSNHSYLLGFNPWQVDRREAGTGGVYEDPTEDELTQLKRFLAYGVIKGIEPGQVKLEDSQLPRTPRTPGELKAQAYMIGNCGFCHLPHGYPSVTNAELLPFNLWPKRNQAGGTFNFPLNLTSSRVKIGGSTGTPVPYIYTDFGNPHGAPNGDLPSKVLSNAAEALKVYDPGATPPFPSPPPRDLYIAESGGISGNALELLAPWNSVIWRNVYTPFTYGDDSTIFVHMPRHVPGYDCRAHKIMAEWMLGLPVRTKVNPVGRDIVDINAFTLQPTELKPGDIGYEDALAKANQRVKDYLESVTGQHCPDDEDIVEAQTINSDFRAPPKEQQLRRSAPRDRDGPEDGKTGPTGPARLNSPRINQAALLAQALYDEVPSHAHFVPLDATEKPGDWRPRREDWPKVLTGITPQIDTTLNEVIEDLQQVRLSREQENLSLDPVPMGLWESPTTCASEADAVSAPTVAQLQADGPKAETLWLFDPRAGGKPTEPNDRVHFQSRGQAVVRAICQNCHGSNYDSRSPLSATISELTGGLSRVANFRAGILGPENGPGSFAANVFTFAEGNTGGTPADWQARYMLFMGMGGTRVQLPEIALRLVAGSPFYGQAISVPVNDAAASGNMLQSAEISCSNLLDEILGVFPSGVAGRALAVRPTSVKDHRFLPQTGHYSLWESLCNFGNEPLIRVFTPPTATSPWFQTPLGSDDDTLFRSRDRNGQPTYPADAPVGTAFGLVDENNQIARGVRADNQLPWCVRVNENASCAAKMESFKAGQGEKPSAECERSFERFSTAGVLPQNMPFCPSSLFASVPQQVTGGGTARVLLHRFPGTRTPTGEFKPDKHPLAQLEFRRRWLRRGAMNAGLAAYYYYDALSKGRVKPALAFDACGDR